MSADNGIFYREIDGWWYVMHGFASDERADVDYVTKGIRCEDLAFCLMQAHGLAESYSVLEYGIVHDPSPQPPPNEPDPERISACLQFCYGVSTKDLDRGNLGRFVEAMLACRERLVTPTVLQAIEILKGNWPQPSPMGDGTFTLREVAQAILEDAGRPEARDRIPIRPAHYRRLKELLSQ